MANYKFLNLSFTSERVQPVQFDVGELVRFSAGKTVNWMFITQFVSIIDLVIKVINYKVFKVWLIKILEHFHSLVFYKFIGFYDSVLTCKPKFGVFDLYILSVCITENMSFINEN